MTLLIVDDDTLVAQSLQAILEASFLCMSSTNLIFS